MISFVVLCVGGGSDDEDLNEGDPLEFDGGFSNIVVVDNIPIVPTEKFEKLEGVVRKISSQMGVIKEEGLWIPIDPASQKTLGYCFVEFNTPQVHLFLPLPAFCINNGWTYFVIILVTSSISFACQVTPPLPAKGELKSSAFLSTSIRTFCH